MIPSFKIPKGDRVRSAICPVRTALKGRVFLSRRLTTRRKKICAIENAVGAGERQIKTHGLKENIQ
jgi:hypothetical protein